MGVGGVFSEITRDDILRACAPYPLANPEATVDRILDVAQSWPEFAQTAGLSSRRIDRVGKYISACAKLLAHLT
jgi:hypothetical protein